jgi:hypothetical protein
MAKRYIKTEKHSSFSGHEKAAKLENVLSLATVVATLLRIRARACVVLTCLAAMLCAASIASANPTAQAKTRVWDFDSAAPLHTWLERSASSRTHLENQSSSAELASASPHAAKGAPQVGRTVLGHYPAYVEKAAELGARRFNVPTDIWNKMSPAQQWAANQKFLDRMIARGDQVILATQANAARAGSFFARELQYLKSQGYQLADDGLSTFKP